MLAGTLTTIAFIPQLQQTWRTRSANDVSLGMLLTFITGVFLWLNYGLMLDALPIILANLITLVLTLAILILKMRYRSYASCPCQLSRSARRHLKFQLDKIDHALLEFHRS